MAALSATDALERFAEILEAVEHRGETFTVVHRGRAIAMIAPARRASAAELRRFLRADPPDPEWTGELEDLRRFVGPAPTADPCNG